MEVISKGSLYIDNRAIKPGGSYIGEFTIGDTDSGKAITWNKVGSLLVAAEPIVINISWNQVNECGFIYGKPICIDGQFYICRSMRLGAQADDVANEWVNILQESGTTEDNDWHWREKYFWGQEEPSIYEGDRVIAGFANPTNWRCTKPNRFVGISFRPVLEEIVGGTTISDALLGKTVVLYSKGGKIKGVVQEITEYDLMFDLDDAVVECTPSGGLTIPLDGIDLTKGINKFVSKAFESVSTWISADNEAIFVERQAIDCAQIIESAVIPLA